MSNHFNLCGETRRQEEAMIEWRIRVNVRLSVRIGCIKIKGIPSQPFLCCFFPQQTIEKRLKPDLTFFDGDLHRNEKQANNIFYLAIITKHEKATRKVDEIL